MFRQRIEFKYGLYIFVGEGESEEAAKANALEKAKLHSLTERDITTIHDAYKV